MAYSSPCAQSLTDLLTGFEKETKLVYCIPHGHFRHWKNCLPIFLKAGIISKSMSMANTVPCAECGSDVRVEKGEQHYFCQCTGCGLVRKLPEEEITLYETTLDALADFVQANMHFERNRETVATGRLIYVGRHTFHNGEYAVFLARGLMWKDRESMVYAHCQPPNHRTHTLILSVCDDEAQTGNSRIVQVPLLDLLRVENSKLVFREDLIPLKLRGVYADAKSHAKAEGEKRFTAHFKTALKAGDIQQGDKGKWQEIAVNDFGMSQRTFRTFWQKNAPKELKQAGNPGKKRNIAC